MNPNELKSAEELATQVRDILRFYSTYPNAEVRQLECLQRRIADIQLNAYKAGMTEAAEIAVNGSIRSPSIARLIISARDREGD